VHGEDVGIGDLAWSEELDVENDVAEQELEKLETRR
jgi:hypothetical protein